jgi:hypothetical protein
LLSVRIMELDQVISLQFRGPVPAIDTSTEFIVIGYDAHRTPILCRKVPNDSLALFGGGLC